MLEYDLIKKYADSMNSANEILFLDKLIQKEFRFNEADLDYIEENARDMLVSVKDWQKDIREYKKIIKALRKDLDEIDTTLQEDASDADNEDGS